MVKRFVAPWAILALFAGTIPARADERGAAGEPAVVVRLKSIDGLIEDAKYVAQLVGHDEEAKQAEGFLRSFLGEKGSEGIDPTRPIGFYGSLRGDLPNSNGAVLIPITSEKSFVEMLERFNVQAAKDADGVYTLTLPAVPVPVPIYMREANKYAYVTAQNKSNLDKKNLREPVEVFKADPVRTVSATFYLDRVPGDLKEFVVGGLDMRLADEQGKKQPGETKAQQAFRSEALKQLSREAAALLKEGGRLDLYFDVDREAHELVAEASLSGRSGSGLAKRIAGLGQAKSVVAGLPGADAAMSMLAHVTMPENLREALAPVIDEALAKATQNMTQAGQREQAEKLFKAAEPTLKSGELDVAFAVRGPAAEQAYTFVAGARVKDGLAIETALKDLVRSLPERDRAAFKLDLETTAGARVHRIDAQSQYNEQARKVLGSNPVFVALRSDLVVLAAGPDGLSALKSALAAPAGAGPLFGMQMELARMVPLFDEMSPADARRNAEQVRKAAKESFGGMEKGGDRVRVTVNGGEKFTARYAVGAAALKFFGRAARYGHADDDGK
jgi:hypothetical protein